MESIQILKSLIRLNSENPPGNTRHTIEWIQKWAEKNKIPVKTQYYDKNQGNIILTVRNNNKTNNSTKSIVMCGHLDTVPAGDLNNWNYDPFGAEESDGYIYGRGSADMKGGISSCLGALKSLNDPLDKNKLNYQIIFLGTSDEEVGLRGAKAAMKLGIMNNVEFLIVPEPTSLKVGISEKGVLWYSIRAFGKAAHGSTPEKGINAIEELVNIIPLLKDAVPQISHPILGTSTINIGTIEGGKSSNVVPEFAEIHCDYRLVPPIDIMDFANELSLKINEVGNSSPARFETGINQTMAPVSNSPDNKFVQQFMQASNNEIPIGLNYGTDAAVLITEAPNRIPFVIYGPGDPKAIHIANERVQINEVLEAESVVTQFLKSIVKTSFTLD